MLTKEEQQFIKQHLKSEVTRLILSGNLYPNLDIKKLANQIAIRKKALTKLPTWAKEEAVFFPPSISWQQCSSEFTAVYKANLLKGKTLVDLTGGFGVDAFYFAQQFDTVTYIEQQDALSKIANYNYGVLGRDNINVINEDSLSIIKNLPKVDIIYLDPARRNAQEQKIITLEDSTPNIIEIQRELLEKAQYVMVKTSPMLDIYRAIESLERVEAVHVIAVENECKELLFIMSNRHCETIKITSVNITRKGKISKFESQWNKKGTIEYTNPKKYLYDPNKAIRKAGILNEVGKHYNIKKLAASTNLFTSDVLIENFQGRVFELKEILKPSKRVIQRYLTKEKGNLIVRNFPDSVANLKKMWKIKDGGNDYMFAVTLANKRKVVLATKRVII